MFCTKCGAEVADGVKFCTSCGAAMKQAANDAAGAAGVAGAATAGTTPPPRPAGQPIQQQTPQYNQQRNYQPNGAQRPIQQTGGNSSTSNSGQGKAIGSVACGAVGIVLWFFGYTSILSLILGIVGAILARSAASDGFNGGLRTAGMILSIISIIVGAIVFVVVLACASAVGCTACSLGSYSY